MIEAPSRITPEPYNHESFYDPRFHNPSPEQRIGQTVKSIGDFTKEAIFFIITIVGGNVSNESSPKIET